MKAVDILRRIHRHQHFFGIDLRGQRQLDQDSVDVVAPIEMVDEGQQLGSRGGFRRSVLLAEDTHFFTALHFAANVNLRRGIVPHQHNSQARTHARLGERFGLGRDLRSNFTCYLVAVQNRGRHPSSPSLIVSF